MSVGRTKLRIVAPIVQNECVLIVQYTVGNKSWWCFPGGHQELGEKQTDAVIREPKEELKVYSRPLRLPYTAEFSAQE